MLMTPDSSAVVVTVVGQRSIQTLIQFAEDEMIENIALGDAAAWQVTPNKRANMLFIKPLYARGRTNMTVVTNRRRYLFDLAIAGPKGAQANSSSRDHTTCTGTPGIARAKSAAPAATSSAPLWP